MPSYFQIRPVVFNKKNLKFFLLVTMATRIPGDHPGIIPVKFHRVVLEMLIKANC